ncbi:class I SAM-dependent methyltransferase [Thalassobaculum litoreum]|uniref:Methyltransferase domain-containing protein n=1 Tax=Thalassobaculum litoreum DSM 18839 TaxID=1123362 RepID=A0A8G2BLU3_9PROT|nr:class I SAM-dependent methyltransferase [Thalassobaculum litoreum]SDG45583.1 Methyltransferase domain-containing protein [Thalassobaculum litoreum DSM 18839]
MSEGWVESADAWIAEQGESGDLSRRFVLDARMLDRVAGIAPANALDVGCGEGRFCRILRARGIATVGIDPTRPLLDRARALDPDGDYRDGVAEALPVPDAAFDLVVSYLTLIDIPDIDLALAEMTRVLRPGGALLIANLNGFATALVDGRWKADTDGIPRFRIDNYLEERTDWAEWKGIRVRNRHRPLSRYMSALLHNGLILRHFDEPAPTGGTPDWADRNTRVPFFHVMEWRKPG